VTITTDDFEAGIGTEVSALPFSLNNATIGSSTAKHGVEVSIDDFSDVFSVRLKEKGNVFVSAFYKLEGLLDQGVKNPVLLSSRVFCEMLSHYYARSGWVGVKFKHSIRNVEGVSVEPEQYTNYGQNAVFTVDSVTMKVNLKSIVYPIAMFPVVVGDVKLDKGVEKRNILGEMFLRYLEVFFTLAEFSFERTVNKNNSKES